MLPSSDSRWMGGPKFDYPGPCTKKPNLNVVKAMVSFSAQLTISNNSLAITSTPTDVTASRHAIDLGSFRFKGGLTLGRGISVVNHRAVSHDMLQRLEVRGCAGVWTCDPSRSLPHKACPEDRLWPSFLVESQSQAPKKS